MWGVPNRLLILLAFLLIILSLLKANTPREALIMDALALDSAANKPANTTTMAPQFPNILRATSMVAVFTNFFNSSCG